MDKDKVDSAPSNVPRQPSGSRDATAATTVVEAQEAGEQARLRDDTEWALDGLKPGAAPGTQRDSLATIAEICASRRGRLALRSTGLADDVLTATGAGGPAANNRTVLVRQTRSSSLSRLS
jgi:hypothetical protein